MKKEIQFFDYLTDLIVFVDLTLNHIIYMNQCAKGILLNDNDNQRMIDLVKQKNEEGSAVVEIEQTVYEVHFQESTQKSGVWMVRGNRVGDADEPIDYSQFLKPYHGRIDFDDKLNELRTAKAKDIGILLVELCAKKEYFAENAQIYALLELLRQSFEQYEIFHISINMFLIMTSELTQDEFNEKRLRLHGYIEGCDHHIVNFGYAWCINADEVIEQIELANTYLEQRKQREKEFVFRSEKQNECFEAEEQTLLIIDKDQNVKSILEETLGENYSMIQTDNWIDALSNRKKHIDLILLEVCHDGQNFLSYIRKYHMFFRVPIIVMYANDNDELEFYYKNGISHGIRKPFRLELVRYKIENTLKYLKYARLENHYGSLDKITGLPNVDYFYDLSEKIIKEKQQKEDLVFVYFDISNFKKYNIEYGYDEGDKLLRNFATIISDTFTKYFVGRTSNDHFIVLTNNMNLESNIRHINDSINHLPKSTKIEIRVGIYQYEQGASVALAHDRAKMACDTLKNDYNRLFRYYDQELRDRITREHYILDHIDEAIKNEYIVVYYQPINRVFSGKICAMEALARWNDPELGFLSPADFISVLENNYLIHKLDMFIIDHVCRDIIASEKLGEITLPVSINLSRIDFQMMNVCKVLQDSVKKYGIERKYLHPEVTESMLNDNEELLAEQLNMLRTAGFEVWLDDFGSEYSGLNTLQNYKFDLLKIDMKLMASYESNANVQTIIASIVDMAKRLHMRVLAEGVETKEQYEFLKQIGCDKAQGYYISKPLPIESFYGRNIDAENTSEEDFFTSIGKVNFLSPDPIEDYTNGAKIHSIVPTAIVRYNNLEFDYLYANQGFKDCLENMSVSSLEESQNIINDDSAKLKTRLVGVAQRTHFSQQMESVNFIYKGQHINVNAKEIFSNNVFQALFVTMTNLSQLEDVKKRDRLENSLNFIYSLYDRVDLMNIEEDYIENIYMNSNNYRTLFGGKTLKVSLFDFANTDIFSEDKDKFLDFYDLNSINDRMDKHGEDFIANVIRTITYKGEIKPKIYIIIRVNDGQSIHYLSCVRDVFGVEEGISEKSSLLEPVKESKWYQLVSSEIQVSLIEWNMEEKDIYVSVRASRYTFSHSSIEQFTNNCWDKESVYLEDIIIAEQLLSDIRLEKKRCEATLRLKVENGTYRWSKVIILQQYNENGKKIHITGIIQDVEDQVENVEQAKFLNAMPTALGVFEVRDGVTRQLFMNDGYFKMLGDQREIRSQRQKTFLDGIHPEDKKYVLKAMKTIIDGKAECSEACRVITGQGNYIWIRFTSQVVKREDGYILVYTTYVDVDDEIKNQTAFKESEERLAIALETADMIEWEYDCVEKKIIQSGISRKMHGYEREVMNVPESLIASGYVHEDSVKDFLAMYQELFVTKKKVMGEFYVKSKGTNDYWWERIVLTPILDKHGNLKKAIGTSVNITKERQLQLSNSLNQKG